MPNRCARYFQKSEPGKPKNKSKKNKQKSGNQEQNQQKTGKSPTRHMPNQVDGDLRENSAGVVASSGLCMTFDGKTVEL